MSQQTTRLNWKPIRAQAIAAAEALGHNLGPFSKISGRKSLKMANCETCYGCCWIAFTTTRGYGAGGRLLKYRCGTPEAAGLLAQEAKP